MNSSVYKATSLFLGALLLVFSHPSQATPFQDIFDNHPSIMLLINVKNGKIIDANASASTFYGYSEKQLESKLISQINTLTPEQIQSEITLAKDENRRYFIFRHQLASGDIRKVKVSTLPVTIDEQSLLLSIIQDMSDNLLGSDESDHYQNRLELLVDKQTRQIEAKSQNTILLMTLAVVFLSVLALALILTVRRGRLAHQAALQGEATLHSIFNGISDALIFTDSNYNVINCNEGTTQLFGHPITEIKDRPITMLFPSHQACRDAITHLTAPTKTSQREAITYLHKDHASFIGETAITAIYDNKGKELGFIFVIRNITDRIARNKELRLAASVFSNTSEGILITDTGGTLLDVNAAYTHITGYQREEVIGKPLHEIIDNFQQQLSYPSFYKALKTTGSWQKELEIKRKNGDLCIAEFTVNLVHNAQGEPQQFVALFSDITEKKQQERQLRNIAHFDALTALPNRILLADRLQHSMYQTLRRKQRLAVIYIDIDGFKAVNDTWGHDTGDRLLVKVANNMRDSLRKSDTIARIGGDEFVAIFSDLPSDISHEIYLNRLLQAAEKPVMVEQLELQVSASMGVTFYPQESDIDADQLLRQADQAMYKAKLAGKAQFEIFDAEHDRQVKGKNDGICRLKKALRNNEFVLFYQPKVNMVTGELIGVEALIRWQHPDTGLVPPNEFLPLIEDHPLAIDVGEWVIESALTTLAEWHRQGLKISVSVNVGSRQIQESNFKERLQYLLAKHPTIAPQYLDLEILESSVINELAHVSETIEACSQMGVSFALDDFGTGYSSLNYLKKLPANLLKVDRSFIKDIDQVDNEKDIALLKGIVGLANAFELNVIAEGVENETQGCLLIGLGCTLAQGFGIAKPMPAADIMAWVDAWRPPAQWHSHCHQLPSKTA